MYAWPWRQSGECDCATVDPEPQGPMPLHLYIARATGRGACGFILRRVQLGCAQAQDEFIDKGDPEEWVGTNRSR